MDSKKEIWTIGHSTRSYKEFLELLQLHNIDALVDVRSYPGSRKFPHFNKENLERELLESNIQYFHFPNLGGRRKALTDSKNTAWRLPAFRSYADYMETDTFKKAISRLEEIAKEKKVGYMCAEAVWWSCHRSLISDYLKNYNWTVLHIMGKSNTVEHPFTKPARIEKGKLYYN